MARDWLISRRTFLKGLGAALPLPLLDVMGWADPPPARDAARPPLRLGFVYVPCGMNADAWWPDPARFAAGSLSPTLEPLKPVINDCLILGGLSNGAARPPDGAHSLEMASWLTATLPGGKTDIRLATSIDQIAAQTLGRYTALPSLELSLSPPRSSGVCGSEGYSYAYTTSLSWRSPTQPNPAESDPRAVLARLFSSRRSRRAGGGGGPRVDAAAFQTPGQDAPPSLDQSMLDLVQADASAFAQRISADDRQRLDEYLEGIRGLERRIVAIERQQAEAAAGAAPKRYATSPTIQVAVGTGTRFDERARVMCDLLALAFQTDVTRVGTLALSLPQPFTLSYPELGFGDLHHGLSHWKDDPAKPAKLAAVDRYHVEQFAFLVQRLKGLKEGGGSVLDSCILTYGSGMGDGFAHSYDGLPTIVAGRGCGTVRTGRYVAKCQGVHGDLLLGILARAGCRPAQPFAGATRPLPDLS